MPGTNTHLRFIIERFKLHAERPTAITELIEPTPQTLAERVLAPTRPPYGAGETRNLRSKLLQAIARCGARHSARRDLQCTHHQHVAAVPIELRQNSRHFDRVARQLRDRA